MILSSFVVYSYLSICPFSHKQCCLMIVLCFCVVFRSMLAVIEPGGGGCGGRTFNLQHHGGAAPYPGRDPFKHQASRAPASFYLNLSLSLSLDSHLHHNTSVFRVLCFFACVIPFCQLAPPRVRQNPSLQHNTPFF